MAPSTTNPSSLHRAPIACFECRAAKVRCLVSQRHDRCDRCITNNTGCVFAQPKRARARMQPSSSRHARAANYPQEGFREQATTAPSSPPSNNNTNSTRPPPTSVSHEVPHSARIQQCTITAEIRLKILAALATLKGQRVAPFSFIESEETGPLCVGGGPQSTPQTQNQSPELPQLAAPSLKLSSLLRPLGAGSEKQPGSDADQLAWVKMPGYGASMTLGHTITDPIEDGIISRPASVALFEHFMLEMNAKWEYVLDPHMDTHDSVRNRSRLLFATILFCSSKFVNHVNGCLDTMTDPFLQGRLCSIARNLAVRGFAKGDRSIETMQALYLLVCWKDADDDISYMHSGYAYRILHDLEIRRNVGNSRQVVRHMRIWSALFRQDKQQGLFFTRGALLGVNEDPVFVTDLDTWLKQPHALPSDFVACCSADLRQLQAKLGALVHKASPTMLPCLLELMDSELNRWKLRWKDHLEGEGSLYANNDPALDQRLLYPGKRHLTTLSGLWEHSVRLHIASSVLRRALVASAMLSSVADEQEQPSSSKLDLPTLIQDLSTGVTGLNSSIDGAFGTLRHLLAFPTDDLRRSPDAVLLLGPNAALFLCVLLCLPGNGILGPSFQKAAISLIQDVTQHVGKSVQSPQDTICMHYAYLNALVGLLSPAIVHEQHEQHEWNEPSPLHPPQSQFGAYILHLDETTLQATQTLAVRTQGPECIEADVEMTSDLIGESYIESLAYMLDASFFWETLPPIVDLSAGS